MGIYRRTFMTLLPAILLLFSWISLSAELLLDSIVATVGNKTFTYSDILQEGELLNLENGIPITTPLNILTKQQIRNEIITRYILWQEAISEKLTLSPSEVDKKVEQYRRNKQTAAFMKRWGLHDIDFRAIIRFRMLSDHAALHYLSKVNKNKKTTTNNKKRLKEWTDKLKKRWKIVLYPIP